MPQPHPDVQALLDDAGSGPALDPTMTVPQLRGACDTGVLRCHDLVRRVELHEVRDHLVGSVPVRLYLPRATPVGLHVHLHGGGWWMGSIETTDPMARDLAAASGLAVLSVGYRLAPEAPWPAAPEDVYAALQWAAETFPELSLSIGGESAGANLAAVVALMARDRSGPPLVAQWLDVPAVDLTLPRTPSFYAFGTGFGLEVAQFDLLTTWYLAGGTDPRHPLVSPAFADLQGLPPALVTTAELDPIRDQGEAFAEALRIAGVEVTTDRAVGHIHASSWLTAMNAQTAERFDRLAATLAQHHAVVEVSA
ncbi:MAG: Esterase/lipase [Frankiales bacterium]|nr:Esterase/lipase [Frankiales bacterium]